MLGPDRIFGVVEIGEVAGAYVDRTDTETHLLELIRSKSTSPSSVEIKVLVSYQLVAAAVPFGRSGGGGNRGLKKPGTPFTRTSPAAYWLMIARAVALRNRFVQWTHGVFLALTNSQNVRSFATRSAAGLPAMMAQLIAPIEMPAYPRRFDVVFGQRLENAGLVRAESPAALQQ